MRPKPRLSGAQTLGRIHDQPGVSHKQEGSCLTDQVRHGIRNIGRTVRHPVLDHHYRLGSIGRAVPPTRHLVRYFDRPDRLPRHQTLEVALQTTRSRHDGGR